MNKQLKAALYTAAVVLATLAVYNRVKDDVPMLRDLVEP